MLGRSTYGHVLHFLIQYFLLLRGQGWSIWVDRRFRLCPVHRFCATLRAVIDRRVVIQPSYHYFHLLNFTREPFEDREKRIDGRVDNAMGYPI